MLGFLLVHVRAATPSQNRGIKVSVFVESWTVALTSVPQLASQTHASSLPSKMVSTKTLILEVVKATAEALQTL